MADPPKWNGTIAKSDLQTGMDRLQKARMDALKFMALKKTDPLDYYAELSRVMGEIGAVMVDLSNVLEIMNGAKVPSVDEVLAERAQNEATR